MPLGAEHVEKAPGVRLGGGGSAFGGQLQLRNSRFGREAACA